MSDLWTNTQWETMYAVVLFHSTLSCYSFNFIFILNILFFIISMCSFFCVCVCVQESERKEEKANISHSNGRFSSSIFACCFCTLFDSCTALDSTLRTTLSLFSQTLSCFSFILFLCAPRLIPLSTNGITCTREKQKKKWTRPHFYLQ